MFEACPSCGSRHIRPSHARNRSERWRSLMGFVHVRCRDCGQRFSNSLWQLDKWRYARCPRCFRLDLGTWSETHYIVKWDVRLLLSLGAKRYRCEVCRHNFASFRQLKEQFSFHPYRKENMESDK